MNTHIRTLFGGKTTDKAIKTTDVVDFIRQKKYEKHIARMRKELTALKVEGLSCRPESAKRIPLIFWHAGKGMEYNGRVLVSLYCNDEDRLSKTRKLVNSLPQVVCSYRGSSGETLKVVFAFALTDGGLPKSVDDVIRFHSTAYCRAAAYLLHLTGITADGKNADLTAGSRMSMDSGIFFNADYVPMRIELPDHLPDSKLAACNDISSLMPQGNALPGYSEVEMDILRYNFICRSISFGGLTETDEMIVLLAAECVKAGINQETAIRCALHDRALRNKDLLVRTTFEQAYSEHRTGMKNVLPQQLIHQEILRDYLTRRYRFRKNVVTGSVEYVDTGMYVTQWSNLDMRARKTMCIEAQKAGIVVWDMDINRIVESQLVNLYNPITDWMNSLPGWDGRDRLGELALTVRTDWNRWEEYFKIWMRAMVAQWMQRDSRHGATMVLMLIGKQGTRKSTFLRSLLPPELTDYYNDRIDFVNKKEAERALMRFALINIDEYDQISKAQMAYLKHILQKCDVKWRRMYQEDIEQENRYAAFCATTNSPTPLTDPTGSRRYLCINVDDSGIDTGYNINYEQIYAQIIHEIKHGKPYFFNAEAEETIQEHNGLFTAEIPLRTMFYRIFAKPDEHDCQAVRHLSCTELVKAIKKEYPNIRTDESTAIRLGKILTNDRIPRHRTHTGYTYAVTYATNSHLD